MSDTMEKAVEELKGTWESHFKPLTERLEAEQKARGEETAETKAALDKVNEALDTIEVRFQKLALDSKAAPEIELEAKAYYAAHGADTVSAAAVAEYRRRFWDDWARKGVVPEVKDLTIGNDTQAGFLVPDTFMLEVLKGITEFSPVRDYVRVIPIGGGSLQFPKRTGTPTATWRGETEAMTETNLTVGLEEIPTHELSAYVDVSFQLLEDGMFDIEAYVRQEVAEAFGVAEGLAFVSGSGSKRPEGILNGGIPEVETATNDTFVADDLVDLYYEPKTGYAQRAVWFLNRGILKTIRKFKDTNTGQYLWQPGLAGMAPATILDRPYVEVPDMASAVADGAKIAAFGDFERAYVAVERLSMQMQRDPFTQATASGSMRFVFRRRVGGQVVIPEAARILKVK